MEYILIDKGDVYRLDENLNLSLSRDEKIIFTQPLVKRQVNMFSADIDKAGHIHIAAVLSGTLTYIKYADRKTSTTHLMRLPDNFSITSLIINCEDILRLNYCVRSHEGCAIIEYSLKGDTWQGKNLFTCQDEMFLKYVKKNKNECYTVRKRNNSYMLINAYVPDNEIFTSSSDFSDVQGVHDGVVFITGGSAYFNGGEIAKGRKLYVPDMKRVLIEDNSKLKEFYLDSGSRYSGEAVFYNGAREYIICSAENDKRRIISSPFPYIRLEPEMRSSKGLTEEVYMQQRSIFQLQAEIKNLKVRIKRLEDTVKNK